MSGITFKKINKDNWEQALQLKVHEDQQSFFPSVAESLAAAYVVPWDEALDPYGVYLGEDLIGFFYLSYTPNSEKNYWIGGFLIDINFQGKGYGKRALKHIIDFVLSIHSHCKNISLTIEQENERARKLYESVGFKTTGKTNHYNEVVYHLAID